MYYLRVVDKKRRKPFNKFEYKKLLLRVLVTTDFLPVKQRVLPRVELSYYPRFVSLTRIKNRCHISGRGRGIVSKFQLSRMEFHRLASSGKIPGVKRSTW